MKTTVTNNEKLALLGCLVMAQSYVRKLRDIEKVIEETLDADDTFDIGHFSDAFWDEDTDVDAILKRMKIEVEQ